MSEEVFLTAGHCLDSLEENQADAYVTFRFGPPFSIATFLPGTVYGHPDLEADIGVVLQTGAIGPVVGDVPPQSCRRRTGLRLLHRGDRHFQRLSEYTTSVTGMVMVAGLVSNGPTSLF